MFHGNQEYFALKRQLIDESKEKMLEQLVNVDQVYNDSNNINNNDDDDDNDQVVLLPPIKSSNASAYSSLKQMMQPRHVVAPPIKQRRMMHPNFVAKPDADTVMLNRLVYVYEWCGDNSAIYGFGCNRNGVACYLRTNITPGLFVVSSDVPMLREVCKLHGCLEVIQYRNTYECNSFGVWDLFNNYERVSTAKCYLVKIVTDSVPSAHRLYNKFRYDTSSYHYACVQQYFDVTKQILFELLVQRMHRENIAKQRNGDCSQLDKTAPKTVMQWFDADLNVYDTYPAPTIPLITFDIETVSDDPHRVPTGDHPNDVLYTTSIHHTHTNILYTLIYLPLNQYDGKQMHEIIHKTDGYQILPNRASIPADLKNVVECFTTEIDLLKRSMDLLCLPGNLLHILYGYNSISYDIKYLLMRCHFFNLHDYMKKFVWREGYCYGWSQIHLDLFRIIVSRYRFKSYTLNNVSKEIIKDSKTGVSAVNLRFSFFRMLENQKFYQHDDTDPEFDRFPSVRDTLHYNNADTLLVSKLEAETKSIDFIIAKAMACQVPLSTMTTNYNTMQYKLWNECFVVGLNMGLFLATFKAPTAIIHCPIASYASPTDMVPLVISLTDKLNYAKNEVHAPTIPTANETTPLSTSASSSHLTGYRDTAAATANVEKSKFPGGANFCLGAYDVDNVQMYDYVTAYPILMDRKNMSDETLTILPANVLAMIYGSLVRQNCVDQFEVYDYMTHSGRSKSETAVLYYQYINNGLHCGGQFPFTLPELERRQDGLVIIIWMGRRGILSQIVAKFTKTRADTKDMYKVLEETYKMLENRLSAEAIKRFEAEAQAREDEAVVSIEPQHNDDTDGNFGISDDEADSVADDADGNFGISDSENDDTSTKNDEGDGMFGMDEGSNDSTKSVASAAEKDEGDFGFDDNDDEDNTAATDNDDDDDDDTPVVRQCVNNYGFEFVNEYINIYGDQVEINESTFETAEEPTKVLQNLMSAVALEQMKVRNSYELQKSLVSSIYGCVGKLIKVVAASITCMTRSTLLLSAKYCTDVGRQVLYIDTDSIMTAVPPSDLGTEKDRDLSSDMNRMYPFMVMEMKVARKCMFVKRKTYYKLENGELKYGQNVNGPTAWRRCVEYFYNATTIETCDDIQNAFYNFFMQCYDKLMQYEKITPDVLVNVTQMIQVQQEYKTMSTSAQYKMYLQKNYPELADTSKHSVYYHYYEGMVTQCIYRPAFELKGLRDVNLFKYYQNMYTTVFNLIKFTVRRNNEPFNVTISSKVVLLLMLRGFLDAHSTHFDKPEQFPILEPTITTPMPRITTDVIDSALNTSNNEIAEKLFDEINTDTD